MAKKAPAKKAPAKKAPAKKAPAKKAPAKKAPAKKAPAKKAPAKKAPAKKAPAKKAPAKRYRGPSLGKPLQPDATLGAVIGTEAIPRKEITNKIWDYIHKNGLQDSQNKRMINADEKLKVVFDGKKQVSMFEMTKLVNEHLS